MSLQTSIYDNEIFFAITYDGYSHLIIEPDKWNKIANRIPRDPNYWGFWSDFLEDKYGMKFTYIRDGNLTGGAEILDYIYNTTGFGPNYQVYFDVGYKIKNTLQLVNRWSINLNEYSGGQFDGGISTSIEKLPFQAKLRSRMSSKCTINDYANMDGGLLNPISTWQVRLHSKTLEEITRCLSSQAKFSQQLGQFEEKFYLISQPDLQDHSIDELRTVYTQPVGFLNTTSVTPGTTGSFGDPKTSALDKLPFSDVISQYTPSTNGLLKITWNALFQVYWESTASACWQVTPRVVVQRNLNGVNQIIKVYTGTSFVVSDGTGGFPAPTFALAFPAPGLNSADKQYILPSITSSVARSNDIALNSNIQISEVFENVEVKIDDEVYIHLLWAPFNAGGTFFGTFAQIDAYTNDIKFDQLTSLPQSTAEGYRIFDFVNQLLENVTGEKDSLVSSFFSPGGFGYKYILTNGYAIRNYLANIYHPRYALVNLLQDLQAIFCVGIGVKKVLISTNTYKEYLGIESISDFFKFNVIPLSSSETFEWKNKHGDKYCYNKVDLGYTKYLGLNIIQQDEFNTSSSYLLQLLKIHTNEITRQSNLIASGFLIEEQRRNQFIANPGQSLTNDNDIFIIPTAEPNKWTQQFVTTYTYPNNPAVENPGLGGSWEPNFPYVVGNIVKDSSNNWFYIASNNVTSGTNPHSDPTNWTLYLDLHPTILFRFNAFLLAGDVLTFNFGTYVVVSEEFGFPVFQPNPSDPVDGYRIQNIVADWSSGTYSLGDIRFYQGVFYRCTLGVTSSTPPPSDATHWSAYNWFFQSNSNYFVGNIVFDNSVRFFYLCIVNSFGSSTAPSSDPTHWTAWNVIGGTIDFTITPPSPNQIFAERNQPFEICTNVVDPSTIYGGRISPKHILYNWRPILGVGLDFVDPNSNDYSISQIVTTEAIMNSLFTTKFISTEPNKGNVGDLTIREINREFIKDYLSHGQNIFSPKGAECKIKIGWNEMNVLRQALCGETGDSTIDYGGVNLQDDNGVLWFCHIMDISYDLVKEVATLQVQKVRPVIPVTQ